MNPLDVYYTYKYGIDHGEGTLIAHHSNITLSVLLMYIRVLFYF